MDNSKHVMLSGKGKGKGTELMVTNYGIKIIDNSYFFTKKRMNHKKATRKREIDYTAFLIN